MTTVNGLLEEIRDILDEPEARKWTDESMKAWIDEGARDIARTTHHFKNDCWMTLDAGVAEYMVPEDIITIEQAYYDDLTDQLQPLVPRHWEGMDQVWGTRQSWSAAWPEYYTVWGHQPGLRIRLYPVPSVAGHRLHLLYAGVPARIRDMTGFQTVDIPEAWYDVLADYCCFKAHLKDQNQVMMDRYLAFYNGKRDQLLHNNEYINQAREIIPDPLTGARVPIYIADPNWR